MDAVPEQALIMLVMAGGGILLGLVYDIYRLIRWRLRPRAIATFLGDLIYWVLSASLFAGVFIAANFGEVRVGALLGTGIGLILYFILLSGPFIRISSAVCRVSARITGSALRMGAGLSGIFRTAFSVGWHKLKVGTRRLIEVWKRNRP